MKINPNILLVFYFLIYSMLLKANIAPEINSTDVIIGLENPSDMDFTQDGQAMFFTEKHKGLSVMYRGNVHKLYGLRGSRGYRNRGNDLFTYGGQEGMISITLDNNFEINRTIYVFSTSDKYHANGCKSNFDKCNGNIVMKLIVAKDFKSVFNRIDIVKDIQFKPFKSNQPFGGPGSHQGSKIRIGPEGYLWITTGDNHKGTCPQDNSLICGVILRVDKNGNGHPANKIREDKRIYSYGHRNVQGIAFRPGDGRAVITEHGPWHNDEITALTNGGNGGWDPAEKRAGRSACPDKYCGYEPNGKKGMNPYLRSQYMPMSDKRFEDLMPPAYNNQGNSQGMAGNAFLKGQNWGIFEGKMAVAYMGIGFGGTTPGLRINLYDISPDGLFVSDIIKLPLENQRFRSLRMGPHDNNLYAAVDEGKIIKISAYTYKINNDIITEKNISNQNKYSKETLEREREKSLEERRKREQLEKELAELKTQKKKEKESIASDAEPPQIIITSTNTENKQGIIKGVVLDNIEVAELTINGEQITYDKGGNFNYTTFIPKDGIDIIIEVIDSKGITSQKLVILERNETIQTKIIKFAKLNPLKLKGKNNKHALALIIGISKYNNAPEAKYADRDANYFSDFAENVLGIDNTNIKLISNNSANSVALKKALKIWLKGYSTQEKSDIYIFFAGHGLASTDGKELYLLPYDGEPRLLEDTALLRSEIFDTVKSINPKSVTIFLDACYSGQSREKDMIIADARPIAIVPVESDVPENFNVFSASSGSEISGSLPEADHGLFSYFLMKGLEGNADANNDKKITNGELLSYVRSNVTRQAVRLGREQTPQLQGDENRVLVEFN